ncbi:MAG: hypothetical protein J6T99_05545, partial [Oscillospiraceae bacterium]|nr:hypothetical protein [Oscillospiraceae bacterium]
ACGSSDAAAEAAPAPEPTAAAVQPAESAQPRWSPPEEKPVEAEAQPAAADESAVVVPVETDAPQKQA